MKQILLKIIGFNILLLFSSCDATIEAEGNVLEELQSVNVGVDSVEISLIVNKDIVLGSTYSDSLGYYYLSEVTSPNKEIYYFIFRKKGYYTDTFIVEKASPILHHDQYLVRKSPK